MLRLLLVLCAAGSAYAALQPVSISVLCATADAVVVGEVASVDHQWASGRAAIERHIWFSVEDGLQVDGLDVMVPGGTIGRLTQEVEHAAPLELDRRYLLTLRKVGEFWRVLGGEQGTVPLAANDGIPAVCRDR
jgi:hypothetical protein